MKKNVQALFSQKIVMATPIVLYTIEKQCQQTFWLYETQQQRAANINNTAFQKSEVRSLIIVATEAHAGYIAVD